MPPNVLVLCHGNRFRSPLAGAVLSARLGPDRVRTAGVKEGCSGPAALKTREHAALRGYDLSAHRARTVTPGDIDWAGLVLYMDAGNLVRLTPLLPPGKTVRGLGDYVGLARIRDPGFLPRGEELTGVFDLVIEAAAVAADVLLGG